MSSSFAYRNTLLVSWLALPAAGASVLLVQPACGRTDLELKCVAYRYSVVPDPLIATFDPNGQNEANFQFAPPSLMVNLETHQAIQDPHHGEHTAATNRLRMMLADATRESCRLKLEDELENDPSFDVRTASSNCNPGGDFDAEDISFNDETVVADVDDDPGPGFTLNKTCEAACLLDECSEYETGGDFDDPPDHPFAITVQCMCQVEEVGSCAPEYSGYFPLNTTITDGFCVPEEHQFEPAEYCRTSIADFFNASIRTINELQGIVEFDGAYSSFAPGTFNVEVACHPIVAQNHSIETDATGAYTEQDDTCALGCGTLDCADFQSDCQFEDPNTGQGPGEGCDPDDCAVPDTCDCDLLDASCFEGDAVAGVCLPEQVGGADGGSDDGGGSPARLTSAITLLNGEWRSVDPYFQCSQIEPGGSFTPNPNNPPPTSAHSPYALTNGTSFTTGLHHTCPAPSTDDVELSTFDTTLEELCRVIPLCSFSNDLSLTITATEDITLLASGTLTKTGASIFTTEDGAPLSVGDHTLDLCVEHDPTEFIACSAQSIRASAPLGSGVDGHGYFAGELAPDFVPLASKPGATHLSTLTDDGYLRVFLPSGFSFPFYGSTVSSYLWVGANGGINTTNRTVGPSNASLPASSGDPPEIAVYWDDLDPSSGGGVYTWFDGMRFIVSWEDVPHGRDGSASTTNGVSVQAHIYGSGRIELHYLDTDVGDSSYDHGQSATLGIGNLAGTYAVEVSHDDDTLLTSDVAAVGLSLSSNGCLADGLIIPPQVACAASDHSLTVCTPTGDTVVLPLPDVSECAIGSADVAGEVIESGSTESSLSALATPIPIDANGELELDEGVHRIRWWPIDEQDEQIGPAFTQLVFARTWVHSDCSSSSQSMMLFTEDDDTYLASTQTNALALLGLPGEDVLTSSQGDDFIGDGSGAGICEANEGNDHLVGEDGDDTLDAGPGDDLAWGGSDDDLLVGGTGNDVLHGQEGDDILQGDDDDDELWGGLGDDVLEGDDGSDTLYPGSGVDAVYGGSGDDTIIILHACELTSGMLLSGGGGTDTLVLPPGLDAQDLATAGVTVDANIESITTSSNLPTHRASCEPS